MGTVLGIVPFFRINGLENTSCKLIRPMVNLAYKHIIRIIGSYREKNPGITDLYRRSCIEHDG